MDKIEDTKGKKRRVLSEERLSDKKTNNSQKNAKNSENNNKTTKISSKKENKDAKNQKNSNKKIEYTNKNSENAINLIEIISSSFDEENKINSSNFSIAKENVVVFYVESLIDKQLLSSGLLSPLEKASKEGAQIKGDLSKFLMEQFISISSVEEETKPDKIIEAILAGSAVVVLEKSALVCPLYNPEKRAIQEPPTSRVVKGPREGFVEDLDINTALVRKRLKTTDLKIFDIFVGRRTKTRVSLFYLKNIAKPEVVKKLKKQISEIDIDAIIDSYYIESLLETNKFKFFRRVGNTEKPDIFCAKILEGRVGILVDGSPVALTVPFILFEDLQSADDYYNIPALATMTRTLRIIGLIFALLIPGIYVSLQSYNYRILPINFLITLLSSIEGLSIPPLVEILIVLFLFEIIMEASLRMPNSLGMALSIIGALALGNTAVDAGIISPPSIVVVAVSSVALYIIPDQISQTRLLRLLFTAIGGIIGLYGIVTSFLILSTYLCVITSYGVPYMVPFAPSVKGDKKDAFIKHSIEDMKTRPELFADKNKTRQGGDKDVG